MTVRYHWSAAAKAPLHFAAGRSRGDAMATLAHIPGTAFRGAMAAAFLAFHGSGATGFHQLIEETRFGHAYPQSDAGAVSVPLPLSSITCDRVPGFLADGGHGVADLLLPAEAALLTAEAANASEPADVGTLVACRRCAADRPRHLGDGTLPWRGYAAWTEDSPVLVSARVGVQWEGHTNGQAGAERHAIAARQVLLPEQCFAGSVSFPDEETAALATELLGRQDNRLWVGAGRSRGLGEVAVTAAPAPLPSATLAGRQQTLMATLARLCERLGATLPEAPTYVTLTLQSAALLPDAFGRWQGAVDSELLGTWTGLPAGALQVRQSFQEVTWLEGWNAALGLPKPDALALAAGSCWLVRVEGVPAAEALEALQRVEDEGIGERRQEGFGVLRICEPLHWQVQELGQEQTV